jgi:uncharacterized membrane protein YdfJ with MMPL/SSD domain
VSTVSSGVVVDATIGRPHSTPPAPESGGRLLLWLPHEPTRHARAGEVIDPAVTVTA